MTRETDGTISISKASGKFSGLGRFTLTLTGIVQLGLAIFFSIDFVIRFGEISANNYEVASWLTPATSVALAISHLVKASYEAVAWLAPMATLTFGVGWFTLHLVEVMAKHGRTQLAVAFYAFFLVEVLVGCVIFFSGINFARHVGVIYIQLILSGGFLRFSTIHPDASIVLDKALKKLRLA